MVWDSDGACTCAGTCRGSQSPARLPRAGRNDAASLTFQSSRGTRLRPTPYRNDSFAGPLPLPTLLTGIPHKNFLGDHLPTNLHLGVFLLTSSSGSAMGFII